MNRRDERLIWAKALHLFTVPVLQGYLLESIRCVQQGMPACDIPRFASPEGMSEVAAQILDDIDQSRPPLKQEFRSLNREHLRALKYIRFDIASEVLRYVPSHGLTPLLSEIKFASDVGS